MVSGLPHRNVRFSTPLPDTRAAAPGSRSRATVKPMEIIPARSRSVAGSGTRTSWGFSFRPATISMCSDLSRVTWVVT